MTWWITDTSIGQRLKFVNASYTGLKCPTAKGTSQTDSQISQNENPITP